jgi:hypothetical protein
MGNRGKKSRTFHYESSDWSLRGCFVILALVGLATMGVIHYSSLEARNAALRARAERIFALEREKRFHAPDHQLNRLSVALGFKDYPGVEKMLAQLEPMAGIPGGTR